MRGTFPFKLDGNGLPGKALSGCDPVDVIARLLGQLRLLQVSLASYMDSQFAGSALNLFSGREDRRDHEIPALGQRSKNSWKGKYASNADLLGLEV